VVEVFMTDMGGAGLRPSEARTESANYDVIVVGAGPAGISAAINVANRKKRVVVMDSLRPFSRPRLAPSIPNYPGLAFARGEDLGEAFIEHLERFHVPVLGEKVSKVFRDGGEILVFTDQAMYRTRAVVIATGAYREADLEGETENVGRGVNYCVSCDGRLYAGREVAYISFAPEGEEEASVLADDFDVTLTYLPQYEGEYHLPEGVRVIPGRRPDRVFRDDDRMHVQSGEDRLDVDGVFIYRKSVPPADLVIGVEMDGPHVAVDRQMRTSVPGVFAAGDCTGEPYQIAKSAGEGQVAGLQAVRYLRELGSSGVPGGGGVVRRFPGVATVPAASGTPAVEAPTLKPEDRAALGRILRERMVDTVRLLHFTRTPAAGQEMVPVCDSCGETLRLLEEFCALSPLLVLDVRDLQGEAEAARELSLTRIPVTLVAAAGEERPRIRFFGLPSGYEFGVLLDDILDISTHRQALADKTLEALAVLPAPVHAEVLTTSTCPICPGVVRLTHRFAQASPRFTADMVVVTEFPELAQRYQVMTVPKLVLNGQAAAEGPVDEARLLALVQSASVRAASGT
jgi:thioredoxin reductase (NADPH)